MTSRAQVRKALAIFAVGGLFALGPNGCKSSDSDEPGTPGAGTDCSSDKDCREFDLLCDPGARVCVECLNSNHCSDLEICVSGECVAITPCTSSRDCPSHQVCSESLSRCVDCVQDADCADGEVCAGELCRAACASDKDCRQFDLLCATASGYCVECTSDTHCPGSQRCSPDGTCVGGTSEPPGTGGRAAEPAQGGAPGVTGGAPAVEAGAPATQGGDTGAGGAPSSSGGSENEGGSDPSGGSSGGSAPTGGLASSGGANAETGGRAPTGGATGEAGSGGSPSTDELFPPVAEACELLLSASCLGCCDEVGVFALDREDEDATALLVDAFQADSTEASATFTFTDFEQVGAIFFKLPTELAITDWNLWASYSGGSVEIALTRSSGTAGCVYEPVGAVGTNWTQVGCWPEISTPGPWDQIEVRLRSYDPGVGSLVVTGFEIE